MHEGTKLNYTFLSLIRISDSGGYLSHSLTHEKCEIRKYGIKFESNNEHR